MIHRPVVKKRTNSSFRILERLVPFIVVAGPLMTIPQVYQIWATHTADGVSLIAWIAYSTLSLFWVLYGLAHKDRAVFLNNLFYFVVCGLVVTGVLLFG